MTRLSAVDTAWFHMDEARSAADVVCLLQLDGEVDAKQLRSVLELRLMSRPRFRRRVVTARLALAPPRWQDEPLPSIDHHFTQYRLPAPGGHTELLAAVNGMLNEPLDFRHSPWRVWLIEGAHEGVVLFAKLHHCLGDGFALLDELLAVADEAQPGGPGSGASSTFARPATHAFAGPLALAARLPRALGDLLYLLRMPFDPPNRLRGALGGERRIAWTSAIALGRVKALARACDATVNDVLMAVLAGALRQYAGTEGAAGRDFRALVPVNLRPANRPLDPEHGNRFGLVFVALPVAEPDRKARIARIERTIHAIKESEQALVSLGLLAVLGRVPAGVQHVVEQVFARKASIVVSNVPGPPKFIHLAGRRVRDAMFWVPHPGRLACGVSILSYAGQIRIGVRSDTAAVPDPARIAELVERELVEWEAELANPRPP